MAKSSPSARLMAVVHVGPVSGVVRSSSQSSSEPEPLNDNHLHGPALDECQQILSEAAAVCVNEPYAVKVTKVASDDNSRGAFESLTLVSDCTIFTVGITIYVVSLDLLCCIK